MAKAVQPGDDIGNVVDVDVTKAFNFPLTETELAEKARKSGALKHELLELTEEQKKKNGEMKRRIADKQSELDTVLRAQHEGEEERTVSCTMRKNYDKLTVQYIFQDKIMQERAMTLEERQLDLEEARRKREKDQAKVAQAKATPTSKQAELKQVIREETNVKTKKDLVV